jgi:hypothetical protein
MKWSPNSLFLAVLERKDHEATKSLRDLLFPHGRVAYSDVVLAVYSQSGGLACESVLATNARNASLWLEWRTQ